MPGGYQARPSDTARSLPSGTGLTWSQTVQCRRAVLQDLHLRWRARTMSAPFTTILCAASTVSDSEFGFGGEIIGKLPESTPIGACHGQVFPALAYVPDGRTALLFIAAIGELRASDMATAEFGTAEWHGKLLTERGWRKEDERRRVATGANHPASHSSALRRGPGTPAPVPRRGTRAPANMLHRTPPLCVKTGLQANLGMDAFRSPLISRFPVTFRISFSRCAQTRRLCPECRPRRALRRRYMRSHPGAGVRGAA